MDSAESLRLYMHSLFSVDVVTCSVQKLEHICTV